MTNSIDKAIDWQRPWYASIKTTAEIIISRAATQTNIHSVRPELVEGFLCTDHGMLRQAQHERTSEVADWRAALNQQCTALSLTNHRGLPLSFVDQTSLPEGMAYEAFISDTGKVPTRENLHDFFNALVWLSFPKLKQQLNALQAAQITRDGIGKSRGPARDAATIFDENAALMVVSATTQGKALVDALRNHQWMSAFMDQCDSFGQHADLWLFGHALMEKLVNPYKSITAHLWVVTASEDYFSMRHSAKREWLDVQVANDLATMELSTSRFTPLPVLGVPDWWPDQDREFYADESVFRAKR